MLCVEWHPSGKFFAVGDYGNNDSQDDPCLQFWSADGRLLMQKVIDGGAEVRNVSWNANGSALASASDKLRIWSESGELKQQADSPELLWGVDWHPDGSKILTSSETGRITLWSSDAKVMAEVVGPKLE